MLISFLSFISNAKILKISSTFLEISTSFSLSDNTNLPSFPSTCPANSITYSEKYSGDSITHSVQLIASTRIPSFRLICTSFIESPAFHLYLILHFLSHLLQYPSLHTAFQFSSCSNCSSFIPRTHLSTSGLNGSIRSEARLN